MCDCRGLDVVVPLTVERYNAFLAAEPTDLLRFQLPIDEADNKALPSHLLVLVGNSKALWLPFLEFVQREVRTEHKVLPNPIDRYVQQSVQQALANSEDPSNPLPAPSKVWLIMKLHFTVS